MRAVAAGAAAVVLLASAVGGFQPQRQAYGARLSLRPPFWGAQYEPGRLAAATTDEPEAAITYYSLLGVPYNATVSDIKVAYRNAARTAHPDAKDNGSGDTADFQTLTEAYKVLSDPELRASYDAKVRAEKIGSFVTEVGGLGVELVKEVGIPVATAAIKDFAVPFFMRTAKQGVAAATAAAANAQKAVDTGVPLSEAISEAVTAAGAAAQATSLEQTLEATRKKMARMERVLREARTNVTDLVATQSEWTTELRATDSLLARRAEDLKTEDRELARLRTRRDEAIDAAEQLAAESDSAKEGREEKEKAKDRAELLLSAAEEELVEAQAALEAAQLRLRDGKAALLSAKEDLRAAQRGLREVATTQDRAGSAAADAATRLDGDEAKLKSRNEQRHAVQTELLSLGKKKAEIGEALEKTGARLKTMEDKVTALEKRIDEMRAKEEDLVARQNEL